MNGTIITSIAATERVWAAWAKRHGLDVVAFLPTMHGMRSIDTIARLALPDVDPETEAQAILAAEIEDTGDVVEIEGRQRS